MTEVATSSLSTVFPATPILCQYKTTSLLFWKKTQWMMQRNMSGWVLWKCVWKDDDRFGIVSFHAWMQAYWHNLENDNCISCDTCTSCKIGPMESWVKGGAISISAPLACTRAFELKVELNTFVNWLSQLLKPKNIFGCITWANGVRAPEQASEWTLIRNSFQGEEWTVKLNGALILSIHTRLSSMKIWRVWFCQCSTIFHP